jgi:hypothetical protein
VLKKSSGRFNCLRLCSTYFIIRRQPVAQRRPRCSLCRKAVIAQFETVKRRTGGKSTVLVYRSDMEKWMATHFSLRTEQKHQEIGSCSTTRGTLRQTIQTRKELCDAIQKLSEQIERAADQLAEQCDPSSSALSIDVTWSVKASRKPN